MPYSSINTSKSGLTVCKVRKFSNNSLRHERSVAPVSRRMNSCRMTISDSYRMLGRLAGGADIEEVEAKVENLEDSPDTEKHASISEKHLSISEKQPSVSSAKHPSVSSEKQPSVVEKQPSISSAKHPSVSSEKHPSIVEKQPSISGKQPSISSAKQPSISSAKQPSISSEKHPSVSSEKHPSVGSEKHPSVISEKQPSIVSEKHPSIVSEKHPSVGSEKHVSVDEKSLLSQGPERVSEHKSVDSTHPKKSSTVSQTSKTSKAAEDDCGTDYLIPPSGPCCTCLSSPTTGDRSVDELIENARHNLQEANKLLSTFPDNFEQELKLLYADVLARVKQWIAMVQSKLTTLENDIETLRKQLIALMCELAKKNREIADLKAQLAECTAAREALEKALAEKTAELDAERAKHAAELDRLKEARPSALRDVETRTAREDGLRPSEVQAMAHATVQCTGGDRDRLRREAELEAELARLRKENERIVKERAEYESAIQRALLRGVSCLNVEALRVLRCPPIPCCSPCAPCPGSKNSHDDTVPCDGRTREKTPKTCGPNKRTCPARNGGLDHTAGVVRRPCASPCCTGRFSGQKSHAENGMVFVLHQGDVGNLCEPDMPRTCGRVKKIDITPCSRESTVSCDAGSADRNSSHEKVCDSKRCKGNNNGQSNGYDQRHSVPKRPSDICFPGVSSREFIDDLVLSFCGTADSDTPPVCGEPIMKRVEIPPCPKFRF